MPISLSIAPVLPEPQNSTPVSSSPPIASRVMRRQRRRRNGTMPGMTEQDPIRVGGRHPFTTPPERRDPARRLRGRLLAPVTVWTAGHPPATAGLTVSSLLVAEGRPPVRGAFDGLPVAPSPFGPVLGGGRPRAACRLAGSTPTGDAELVEGIVEQLELADLEDPLAWLHGAYRSLRDPGDGP